jgi:hypothetical protein
MDLAASRSLRSAMARRNVFDPLEPTREPRWYTVRNMHGGLLEVRRLAAGCDLTKANICGRHARSHRHRLATRRIQLDGWHVLLPTRGVERRMVSITPTDPGQLPGYGASHLTESPGHDE